MIVRFITASPSGRADEVSVPHDQLVICGGRTVMALDVPAKATALVTVDGKQLRCMRSARDVARCRRVMGAEPLPERRTRNTINKCDARTVGEVVTLDQPKGRVKIVVAGGTATIVELTVGNKDHGEFVMRRYEQLLNEGANPRDVVDSLAAIGFSVKLA